ncbi:hypothetical protein NDU88_004323 [Pleurodeles waltl]|uniref:Uncharacterized protein n=1 Tax=Pleurodeles waltl TaxID=8319 RepID=A0AAV7QFS5_PLEWA|nr:hypothetical protein NDU88_004323 [Pleurodeles waltl]
MPAFSVASFALLLHLVLLTWKDEDALPDRNSSRWTISSAEEIWCATCCMPATSSSAQRHLLVENGKLHGKSGLLLLQATVRPGGPPARAPVRSRA